MASLASYCTKQQTQTLLRRLYRALPIHPFMGFHTAHTRAVFTFVHHGAHVHGRTVTGEMTASVPQQAAQWGLQLWVWCSVRPRRSAHAASLWKCIHTRSHAPSFQCNMHMNNCTNTLQTDYEILNHSQKWKERGLYYFCEWVSL